MVRVSPLWVILPFRVMVSLSESSGVSKAEPVS